MIPFIDGRLLALGPWIVPALLAAFVALACLAGSLIETGIKRNSRWRLLLGVPLAVLLGTFYVNFIYALL